MSTALVALTNKLAQSFDLGDGTELMETLKQTAFRGQVSDSQMTALLIVANQYKLNPWTKEIYAFPDANNGIVPVVGVDGWARIINSHDQFDGIEFIQDDAKCTCNIYRKDRSRATSVTEYMSECKREAKPWKSHPLRMLRHKAMIQCARLAFGFVGIYDQDEAERIVEAPQQRVEKDITPAATSLPPYSDADFEKNIGAWEKLIKDGKKTADQIIAMVSSKAVLSEKQKAEINSIVNMTLEAA